MRVKVNFPGHPAHNKIFEAYHWKSHVNSPPCEGWALECEGCEYVLPYEVCREVEEAPYEICLVEKENQWRWEKKGWRLVSTLDDCHHGERAVLMEKGNVS